MDKTILKVAYDMKNNMKVSDIVKKYHVTRSAVYWSIKYFQSSYQDNEMFREQIILGSILGDGYIQKKNNKYVYSECHSLKQQDYLIWKYLMFDDYTNGMTIYNKNFNNKYSDAKEFATSTKYSMVFEKYYNYDISDIIQNINIYGLIIFILDDGNYNNHSHIGNFNISSGKLSKEELQLIQEKFAQYNIKTKLIGKRNDISIQSIYNNILYSYLKILFNNCMEIDVIKNKFGNIKLQ